MQGRNALFIMSDEHSRRVLGAYGNSVVDSPNLDAVASGGTLFENAYCNSPICVLGVTFRIERAYHRARRVDEQR